MSQRTERFPKALLAPLLALVAGLAAAQAGPDVASVDLPVTRLVLFTSGVGYFEREGVVSGEQELVDRKSTRLNSSHVKISYAVFCLKKKNNSNKRSL